MYVDFDKQFIFLHNPRTGGTSLLRVLEKFTSVVLQTGEHETLNDTHEVMLRKSKIWDDYFKFSIVRNPWDRLYSAFKYLQAGGSNFTDTRVGNIFVQPYAGDFNAFVENYDCWYKRPCHFIQYKHGMSPHLLPQSEFLTLDNSLAVDIVCRFENYEQEVTELLHNLGINIDALPKLNSSDPVEDYRLAFTDKSMAIVSELYADDIELFGYTF